MMKLHEFKRLNDEKGFHWFKPNTLRFFKSRVSNFDVITGYFISSEQSPSGPRLYSIRKGDFETGKVETIGDFQKYPSLKRAKTALKKLLRGQ